MLNAEIIRAKAFCLGFSFIGFTGVDQTPHFSKYISRIKEVDLGDLEFLRKPYTIESRRDPSILLEGGKSIIVLGVSYCPPDASINESNECQGIISAYALHEDYHQIIRTKAKELITSINKNLNKKINSRIFIDSGPMMEKDMIYSAGLGWIGKHSIALHPKFGSYFFICCILTDYVIDKVNKKNEDLCGDCEICIHACPTGCISDHAIDPTRCISYLSIEHKGIIPRELRSLMGNRIYGCDICQIVCPINRNLSIPKNAVFFDKQRIIAPRVNLVDELALQKEEFSEKYKDTPLSRLSFIRFMQNIIIAAGNSKNVKCIPSLSQFLNHTSIDLRIYAVWALGNFRSAETKNMLIERLKAETDPSVIAEIKIALR